MSQPEDWGVPEAGPSTPQAFAGRINDSLDALLSLHKGGSRPSYAVAGTMWIDDTATPWLLYLYDGTSDIQIGSINNSTHAVTWAPDTMDYETGTFTPTFGGSVSDPTVTLDIQYGYFTRIGQMVTYAIGLGTDAASGGSGDLRVNGLPFSAGSQGNSGSLGGVVYGWGTPPTAWVISAGQNYLTFRSTPNSSVLLPVSALGSGANDNRLTFSGVYFTT